jgi:hypothetical protein
MSGRGEEKDSFRKTSSSLILQISSNITNIFFPRDLSKGIAVSIF